jgi:predicted amidohydrolase
MAPPHWCWAGLLLLGAVTLAATAAGRLGAAAAPADPDRARSLAGLLEQLDDIRAAQASLLDGAAEEYVVAFVEQQAQSAATGPATLALNSRRAADAADEASAQGAQMIVLPEYGLSGFYSGSGARDAWIPFLEQLPEPLPSREVPCDDPDRFRLAPSLVALSCAARAHSIAIVANIGDLIYCDAPGVTNPGCATSRDGRLQFNTAVALDTDGAYLARAHKQNLWGEAAYFDEPLDCQQVSFTTSFNVQFGLFTCADLIYEFPAIALIDAGLVNFVAPMAWSDEMAQMQALPSYQAWSLAHCVNFVATNHRSTRMSGSGAFSCGRVVASTFDPGTGDGPLHFARLPARPVQRTASKDVAQTASEIDAAAAAAAAAAGSSDTVNGTEPWTFARVDVDGGWQTLCSDSGQVCCTLTQLVGAGVDVGRGYALAALDGVDTGGGISWSGAACAVLACPEPGPGCLEYQQPPSVQDQQLSGVVLAMTTHPPVGNVTIFPMALARADTGGQRLLEPFGVSGELEFTVLDGAPGFGFWRLQAAALPPSSASPLVSAMLYGRPFGRDELVYDCPQ